MGGLIDRDEIEAWLRGMEEAMRKNKAELSTHRPMDAEQYLYGWYGGFIAALRAAKDELESREK